MLNLPEAGSAEGRKDRMKRNDSEPRQGFRNVCTSQDGGIRDEPPGDIGHLREDELARRWRISPRTLQRWRSKGQAPAHLLIGHRVLYRQGDVEAFERRHLQAAGEASR